MTAAGWWLLGGAVLVVFVAGLLWPGKKNDRSSSAKDPEDAVQRAVVRDLWKLARTVPNRHVFRDPETGRYLGVDRHRSILDIVVSDVEFTVVEIDLVPDAIVTSYHLGAGWRPMPPPIMRMHSPVDGNSTRTSWREAGELVDFNDHTGAMNASTAELVDLHAQLRRALRA